MADLSSLSWFVWRLAAMSPREIVHRLGEQAKRRALRPNAGRWSEFDARPGALKIISSLAKALRKPLPDAWYSSARAAADGVLDGQFAALGRQWPQITDGLRRGDEWLRDPVTAETWPGASVFSFDIEYRHNPALGDVKYVWEVNRLQFLQPLAVLALRDGDRRLARFAINSVLSWMNANPPFTGINWTSGIEVALRLVTLAIVVAGVEDILTAQERAQFRGFVAAHACWLKRFPSLYSSANNHRVAEGLGLVTAALLAPDLPECSGCLAQGRAVLQDAVASQYFSDGTGVEQSPTYSAFTLEMLCFGAVILEGTPDAFDAAWRNRLALAASNLRAMLDDQGVAPRIGDDDEGRVIGAGMMEEPRYVASIVSAAASVLSRPDLLPPACDISFRDVIFGASAHGEPAGPGIDHFAQGGYTIIRDEIGGAKIFAVLDHGPLGFGGIAAHGHADALSLWLHIDGIPVFVDSGTYLYHSGDEWREFFRSTSAHNTLEITGLSQSLTAGAFNWRHKAQARCVRLVRGERWEIEGRHDGYRARLGVEHARTLVRTAKGFRVEDRLPGARKPLGVAIRFLVHPALEVSTQGGRTTISHLNRKLAELTAPANMTARLVRGEGDAVGPGWYSPAFGKRVPATCIVFEGLLGEGDIAISQLTILNS